MFGSIFKLASKIVQGVLDVVNKQVNIVQNDIADTMSNMILKGFDDIWRGEDADQFKGKVQKAVQDAQNITNVFGNLISGITKAIDVFNKAESKMNQVASNLNDQFSKIF